MSPGVCKDPGWFHIDLIILNSWNKFFKFNWEHSTMGIRDVKSSWNYCFKKEVFFVWLWFYSFVEVHSNLQIHDCLVLLPRLAWYLAYLISILMWYYYGSKYCRASIQNILQYIIAMVSLAFLTCFHVNVLTNPLTSQEHFNLGCIIF